MDCAQAIKNELMMKLHSSLSAEQLKALDNALVSVLHKYIISDAVSDLVPFAQTENESLIRHFIVTKTIEGLSKRTLSYYENEIRKLLQFLQKPASSITTNDIRYCLAIRIKNGASNTTADNALRIYRSFFKWAAEEEIILKNPTLPIKKIKSEKRIKQPFSEEELEKLRDYLSDTRDRAILEFLFSTGARVSETAALNRDDIDWLKEQCVVYGKGGKERYVYLNAKALFWLRKYLESRDDDNPALFVSINKPHKRLQISAFETYLRQAGRACGVENVHPHRFRRTAATFALRRGMPVDQVRQMLGHTQIQTTLLYAMTDDDATKSNHRKYVV